MRSIIARKFTAIAIAVASFSIFGQASTGLCQTTISAWQFSSTAAQVVGNAAGNVNTLAATTGVGMAMALGMSNNYTYAGGEGPGSQAGCDITQPVAGSDFGWRVRGNSNTTNAGAGQANGWNTAAPEYSQGAQFLTPTTGYSGITFTFDWYVTKQSIKDLQPQYTTDGITWNNFGSLIIATSSQWYLSNTLTLSSSLGLTVANDPNFGVRLVSAYDPSATGGTAAHIYTGVSGTTYNNSSGNWSLGNIQITGNPIASPLATGTAPATTVAWNATSAAWDTTSANWVGGTPNANQFQNGNGALFPDYGGNTSSVIAIASSGVTPAAISVNNSATAYTFTGGPIGGGGTLGLSKSGNGMLTLASSNSYTGGTAITGGTLVVQGGDNRLGATGELFIGGGATLETTTSGIISARPILVGTGGGTFDTGSLNSSASGATVINGPFVVNGGGNLALIGNVVATTTASAATVTIAAGTTLTVGGAAGTEQNFLQSGGTFNGTLVIDAPVRVDFSGSAYGGTYVGPGEVQLSYSGSIVGTGSDGTSAWTVLSDAGTNGAVISGGTLTNNVHLNPAGLAHTHADVTNPNFTLATANPFIVGIGSNAPATNTFAITGNIYGASDVVLGANDAAGDGNGRLLLSGSNTYTGATLISGKGIVALGSTAALPASTDVVFNFPFSGSKNPILDLNGFSQQISSLESLPSGPGTKFTITNSGSVPAALTVSGTTSPAYPYAGQINDGLSTVALLKQGTGLLGLSGTSSYSGGTMISGGTLQLGNLTTSTTASALGIGPTTVQNGGALAGSVNGGGASGLVTVQAGGQLLPGGLNSSAGGLPLNLLGGLTLNASSCVTIVYGQGVDKDEVNLGATGVLTLPTGTNSATINFYNQSALSGIIPLFTGSAGLANSFSSSQLTFGITNLSPSVQSGYTFVLDTNPAVVAARGTAGNPDQIDLFNPNEPIAASVTWNTSSGAWSTSTASTAWTGGNPHATAYKDGDEATFPDYASSSSTITIATGGVQPGAVFLSSSSTAYTFTGGPIAGTSVLYKNGSGLATLSSSNSYSGGTSITGGTLVVAAGDSSLGASSGAVSLDDGATLGTSTVGLTSSRNFAIGPSGNFANGTFNTNGSNSTLSGNIVVGNAATNGGSTFTKSGSGTLTLSGSVTLLDGTGGNGSTLNSQAGDLHISGPISLGSYGGFIIASSATVTLDNSSGSLATVDQNYGGTYNGNLVITSSMRANFNAGTFGGAGAIQIQAPGVEITNKNTSNGATIGVNIQLNSLNLPFAKSDVTQSVFSLPGTNSFVSTIGGTKNASIGPGNIIINGVISGNSDMNFSNSTGGGGSGNITLNAQNTYTGTTMIDFTGNVTGGAQGGIVTLGVNNALPTTTDVVFGAIGGLANAQLDLEGYNQQIGSLSVGVSGNASGYTITNYNPIYATSILTVSGATTPAQPFGGTIADGLGQLAIVKAGPNTLNLSGSNGYSGGTTVNSGALLLNNPSSINTASGEGPVTVNSGGTLGGLGWSGDGTSGDSTTVYAGGSLVPGNYLSELPALSANQPGTLTFHDNLTLMGSSSVTFNLASGTKSMIAVGNTLSLAPSGGTVTINLNDLGGGLTASVVPLFTFGSLGSGSTSSLVIGTAPAGETYGFTESGGTIDLTIAANGPANLTWSGSSSAWDVHTTANFAGSRTFSNSDHVTFDDSGSASTVVIASGGVEPGSVVFNNNSKAYTLTGGPINGPTSLVLSGSGIVTLDNSNNFTGGTDVEAGTLILAGPAALEEGTSLIVGAAASGLFGSTAVGGEATPSMAGTVVPVPEPGTLALLAVGAVLVALRAPRRRTRLEYLP